MEKITLKKTDLKEQMNIVITGHVDHGKSSVIGRLLADTNSLPEGKLEQVKLFCKKNSRPFEYAFLLDALKDEQAQGITIDSARCFFKTKKRDYIIIDAPGHVEFLKNMISGASRAEAALLVIDAKEGIKENSRRHGYILSLLGIKQITILINKMDLIDYSEDIYNNIKEEYQKFLKQIKVIPERFIPITARDGENIAQRSKNMAWYKDLTVLEQLDTFKKEKDKIDKDFRMPIQDIYKFTDNNDDRRIVTGLIESGKIKVGDEVIFYPSNKRSKISSIEMFNHPIIKESRAGDAPGFTLTSQIYIKPGEVMCKVNQKSQIVGVRFKANIFWMSKKPLIKNKSYKLKLSTNRNLVELVEILNIIDSSELSSINNKNQIEQNDVAEAIFEVKKPISYDLITDFETTARFVLIDDYEISGGGIIIDSVDTKQTCFEERIVNRNNSWERGYISTEEKEQRYSHKSKFILLIGQTKIDKDEVAKKLEKSLFENNFTTHYLGLNNLFRGLDNDLNIDPLFDRIELIRRLGEVAKLFTDAGLIFLTTIDDIDDYELKSLKLLNSPNEILIVNIGNQVVSENLVDLKINDQLSLDEIGKIIYNFLEEKEIIIEYYL